MVDSFSHDALNGLPSDYVPYDKRKLSYAGTFTDPRQVALIRTLEWLTGKLTLLRLIRSFERKGLVTGQAFWGRALAHMGIDVTTSSADLAHIPRSGPVVLVANHPHGLVDGMVLAELIGRVRTDYRILTRSLLTGVSEVAQFLIPVPFPHEDEALRKNLAMRDRAMDHLAQGGLVALFPSGAVASSATAFGPAVEAEWNPFTARLIQRSGATVLPVFFPGQNSRAYQIASRVSATIRQGLLLHEVVHALGKPLGPVIGEPIRPEEIAAWRGTTRAFMAALRGRTLSLAGAGAGAEGVG